MITAQKVQEETNLLKQMLENLGFSLIYNDKGIEQIMNEEFIEELFGVYVDNNRIGSCTIINAFNGTIIEITLNLLNALTIPKDIVKQLLLLGFKERVGNDLNYGWFQYKVEIHD